MIRNLPVTFLTTFGHCGIDWVHSLLNSNSQILITPAFSYFRVFEKLKLSRIEDKNIIFEILKDYFTNKVGPKSINNQKKFLNTEYELENFLTLIRIKVNDCNSITVVDFFWIIHECYAEIKNIDIKTIKTIVSHEHLPWHFEKIINKFPSARIMFVMRDPRASIAGLFHGRKKYFGFLPDYTFNETFEIWMHAQEMYFKYQKKLGDNLLVLKNESMHENLKVELLRIVKWLNVDYSDNMLIGTYSDGNKTNPDSLYTDTTNINFNYDEYYLPENIKARWELELKDTNLTIIIEALLFRVMHVFNYKLVNNRPNFIRKFQIVIFFLIPNITLKNEWREKYPNLDEFRKVDVILNKFFFSLFAPFWKYCPNTIKYFLVYFRSIFSRIRIIFFPGKRYNRYNELG